jgi:hypothetical protein
LDAEQEQEKEWYCPICHNFFSDEDPDLLWGKCPECGSTCTFLGQKKGYYLTDALLRQISKELSLPVVDIRRTQIFRGARTFFSRHDCLCLTFVPIRKFGDVLVVASADPQLLRGWLAKTDFEGINSVKVRLVLSAVTDIIALILRSYG